MGSDNNWLLSSCNMAKGCIMWLLLMHSCAMIAAQGCPEQAGCHLVAVSETFRPDDCQAFHFTGNACCGYCESSSFATIQDPLQENRIQEVTSESECCDMDEYVNVSVWLNCRDGRKEFILKSAKSCECAHCAKVLDS